MLGHSWLLGLLLLLIVLILVGPGKLSELGGALGRSIRDFRRTSRGEGEFREKSGASNDSSSDRGLPGDDNKG